MLIWDLFMRVLFLSHRYTDTTIGGLAEFLHYLPLALKDQAVAVTIYTQAVTKNEHILHGPEYLSNGITHYSGSFLKPRFFTSKNELKPLLDLCRAEKIELVHAQGVYRAGFMAMHVYKNLQIPYVVTSHSDILAGNSERIQRGRVLRRCREILKHAAGVTHLTTYMAHASDVLFDTSAKSIIIQNGIDVQAWRPYLQQNEANYMLAIGRLVPEKGFHHLLSAFHKLQRLGNTTTSLVIAGDGTEMLALQQQARVLGLNVVHGSEQMTDVPPSSVIFTGYVRGNRKKELFAGAKLILFASQPSCWEEAFGIVQLEAMAAGKAILASDVPAVRYLESLGMQAVKVKPDDTDAWAEQMAMILQNTNGRHEMGRVNRAQANLFDWAVIAQQYQAFYAKLLK